MTFKRFAFSVFIVFVLALSGVLAEESESSGDEPIVGIDLGTTYSCVTVVKNGVVEVVANDLGLRTVPSWVAFSGDKRLIGQAAKNQAPENPKNTVYDSKRLIGQEYKSVKKDLNFFSFDVVNRKSKPFISVNFKGKKAHFAPEEISAMVLTRMKETAEAYLGQKVKKAVITVPAYFNDAQRSATKSAGEIAGLTVSRIVNEPTAAAMAYGLDKLDKQANIVVYDLGGGTFDVSVLTVDHGVFEVLATNGDTHLGGEDLDKALMGHMFKVFKKQTGVKLDRTNKRAVERLRQAVNTAKHVLSSKLTAKVEVEALYDGHDFSTQVTRARFENIVKGHLQRTMKPVEKVLEDAGLSVDEIAQVVLVGGSTRIPYVRTMLGGYFGNEKINTDANPDEAVAMGAGIQASIIAGQQVLVPGTQDNAQMVLLDVTPLSLGISIMGDVFSVIIPRNTAVPTRKSKPYTTVRDNQTAISIEVYQGESEMAKRNHRLGEFSISVPPAPRGVPTVRVEFFIDANGILQVTATDEGTNKQKKIRITHGKGRFSESQIEKMRARAEKWAERDRAERVRVESFQEIEKIIYDIQKQLDGPIGKKLSEDEKADIQEGLSESKTWIEYNQKADAEEILEEKKKIENVWNPIIRKHYGGGGGDFDEDWDNNQRDQEDDPWFEDEL